jgi:hypothetical protein
MQVSGLGLAFEVPADPRAAKWAMAYWLAGQMVEGSLEPVVGVYRIGHDVAWDLDCPEELQSLVACAFNLAAWDESWGPIEQFKSEAIAAAAQLLNHRTRRRPC